MLSWILVASAFGQISFNHLLDRKAWRHLAVANTCELVLHAALLVTWFRDAPSDQFILLAFSRWLFLNILNADYIMRWNRITVQSVRICTLRYLARLHWIRPAIHAAHSVNLSLKTLWTTLDIYLINMFWTASEAGNYRFAKALGILPSIVFGPIWTLNRQEILTDWEQGGAKGRTRFATVIRLSLKLSALLFPVLLALWLLHAELERIVAFSFEFTWLAAVAFSMWWLLSSGFGWVRYLMVSTKRFSAGNLQSSIIILGMLLTVPIHTFINPQVVFPGIVLASNFVFIYYIGRPHA
jgi:hypothetical protein